VIGVVRARTRHPLLVWQVIVVWLSYPLLYYVTVSSVRYSYPIAWTLWLVAPCAISLSGGAPRQPMRPAAE